MSNFSSEAMHTKRRWSKTFKVLREKKSRIVYLAKLSPQNQIELDFLRQNLKECVASRPALPKKKKKSLQFFREKGNNTGQKLRSTYRKEEH